MKPRVFSFVLIAITTVILAQLVPSSLVLCSPKEADHFAVSKPLFNWQTEAQAKSHSLVIDDIPSPDFPAQAFQSCITLRPRLWHRAPTIGSLKTRPPNRSGLVEVEVPEANFSLEMLTRRNQSCSRIAGSLKSL